MAISSQQFTPENLAHIQALSDQALSDANAAWSRRKLSREVCEGLKWRSPNGKLKEMSCRVALLELARRGVLTLLPARPAPPKRTRLKRREEHHAEPALQCTLSQLGEVRLVPITSLKTKASRQWNALMNAPH